MEKNKEVVQKGAWSKNYLILSIVIIIVSFISAFGCSKSSGAMAVWLGVFAGVFMTVGTIAFIVALVAMASYGVAEGESK